MTQATPTLETQQLRAFAGLTDDALAHLVLIGMLSTAQAQAARKLRPCGMPGCQDTARCWRCL